MLLGRYSSSEASISGCTLSTPRQQGGDRHRNWSGQAYRLLQKPVPPAMQPCWTRVRAVEHGWIAPWLQHCCISLQVLR